jgi:DNA mismatch endonuclease (patch repair protein)
VHRAPLPGIRRQADIVFPRQRLAIFVDGCFWHGCQLHGTEAKANAAFWQQKITRNRERDRETDRSFEGAGWLVVRVWEHEDPVRAAHRIERIVRKRAGPAD